MTSTPASPLVVVSANLAWNLVNFRSGLIRALIERGCRVLAVAPADPAMQARLEAMGCRFAAIPVDSAGLNPWRDAMTFLAYRRLLRRERPAAFLGWTIKPNVYGGLAAGLLGIPALPNISGLGTAFIRRNLLTRVVHQLYRHGLSRAPIVFFQNEDDRARFLEGGLVRPERTRLLPGSGIDPAHFAVPPGGRGQPRRFLMLARVVADKGVREYVEAARQLKRKWPDAEFVLMGFLDVANRTAISADEVAGWEREGAITYLPPADDVRDEIARADFVVLPSYREGMSRVLLEASAMGRPIVTTDAPGCRDIVADGINGYLCAPRDAGSLAEALDRAAQTSDEAWLAMSTAGRARVVAEFSQDRVTSLYLEALRDTGVDLPFGDRGE